MSDFPSSPSVIPALTFCFQSGVGSVPLTVIFCLPSGQDNDINLMKACWNELFALGLAQCSSVMNVGTILSAIINHLQTSLQEGRRAQLWFACMAAHWTTRRPERMISPSLTSSSVFPCISQRNCHRNESNWSWSTFGGCKSSVTAC